MENSEYMGLFLTEESKAKLKEWLWLNGYDFNNDIMKGALPENWYLDHCTLLHWSQKDYYTEKEILESNSGKMCAITVDGIGISDKAMAFRIDKELMGIPCANNIPHITICTFNGGKPADSNDITEWKDIEPILVETKLRKV
jgi:hypothetical protein